MFHYLKGLFVALVALVAMLAQGCAFNQIAIPGVGPTRYRDQLYSVTVTHGVVYGPSPLVADVYSPTGDSSTHRPAIIWVHGGSFAGLDRNAEEIVDEANVFASKGYVSVAIDYRLGSKVCTWDTLMAECRDEVVNAMQDAQTAVRWLRANAATYGVDPGRIAIAGTSAGGMTAMNVGFNSDDPSSTVQAAVSLSGGLLLGDAGPGDAPALLFHNDPDGLVPYAWSLWTKNLAAGAGLTAELVTFGEPGHVSWAAHRGDVIADTTNFLFWMLKLGA